MPNQKSTKKKDNITDIILNYIDKMLANMHNEYCIEITRGLIYRLQEKLKAREADDARMKSFTYS